MHYALNIRIYRGRLDAAFMWTAWCEKALSSTFSTIVAHVDVEIYEHGGWETTNNKMALGGGQVLRAPRFHATCGSSRRRPRPAPPSTN